MKPQKQITTVKEVKQVFRNNNSLYIDHSKDSQIILKYLYRLEKREILYICLFNKSFNVSVYCINKNKAVIKYNN